jgi:hypothetical protein
MRCGSTLILIHSEKCWWIIIIIIGTTPLLILQWNFLSNRVAGVKVSQATSTVWRTTLTQTTSTTYITLLLQNFRQRTFPISCYEDKSQLSFTCCLCLHFNLRFPIVLDQVTKLRWKATISFVISFPTSVCPHGTARFLLDRFSWNLILEDLSKKFSRNFNLYFISEGPCIVKYMSIIVPQDATIYSLFIFVNCSTCFEW